MRPVLIHYFTDRFKINIFMTWRYTSCTCSPRPGQKISDEGAGSMAGRVSPLSLLTSQRGGRPWHRRLTSPRRFDGAARRTSRTPQGPVGKVVGLVLAQDPPQMALIPDEGAVQ